MIGDGKAQRGKECAAALHRFASHSYGKDQHRRAGLRADVGIGPYDEDFGKECKK